MNEKPHVTEPPGPEGGQPRRVLIVSPHFPPVNAADMHRVRQSLPYLRAMGWEPVVLAAAPEAVEGYQDGHLLETIPEGVEVHRVSALDYHWTRVLGLGSLALRALWHLRRAGNRLLASGRFDLVYFSTTMFPVTVLGPYWKKRFGVPYVIDVQDPWRPDHYLERPRAERPPKFWLAYRLDSALEPLAFRDVDGLVSVSEAYCEMLAERYPRVRRVPCRVIPFGGAEGDFEVLDRLDLENPVFTPEADTVNLVYVGRGGHDMARAVRGLFGALADGLRERPDLFEHVRMHFVGTSYAPEGEGKRTIQPLAEAMGVGAYVHEQPARVPYFTALHLLRQADALVIPGSDDPAYTASKLYPYVLARRPLLAVFNARSSVVDILEKTRAGAAVTFSEATSEADLRRRLVEAMTRLLERLPFVPETDWAAFEPYTAREMTRRQVALFDEVVGQTHAATQRSGV